MEALDIIIAPIYFILILGGAYWIRSRVTTAYTRPYFIPALLLKITGALAAGFIYQFYYTGGDTFNFFNTSKIIWEAFKEDPILGFKVLFAKESSGFSIEVAKYVNKMYFFGDTSSMGIVRLCALIGLFTFNTYAATAMVFATLSFSGMWALYCVFYDRYPLLYKKIAIACFFIPSVFFWGSGIFKDSVSLGALGWLLYGFYFGFIQRKNILKNSLIIVTSAVIIINIKIYILLCMLPGLLIVYYLQNIALVKQPMLKWVIGPVFLIGGFFIGKFALDQISDFDQRYAINNIATTSKITADDIRFVTGKDAGSGYTLNGLDGTTEGMIKLAPQAINVALFRPYLWEVKNILMLLSSAESFLFLVFTIVVLFRARVFKIFSFLRKDPWLLFCLFFTLLFAFGVGVSSFNFGTLSRYKLPLLPFFGIVLAVLNNNLKKTI